MRKWRKTKAQKKSKNPEIKKWKRAGYRDGLMEEMKKQGEDEEGEVCGGGIPFF